VWRAGDQVKEHGCPHELWTTRLFARRASTDCRRGLNFGRLVQERVRKIVGIEEIKPHKVRY
jgi:hypothetical protein